MNKMHMAEIATKSIGGLNEIASEYRLIFCDVWGVVHNGERPWPDTLDALVRFRDGGGTVILVTNAPRRRKSVYAQLEHLGVPEKAYDKVVTSGDVTRDLIDQSPKKILHIGPKQDLNLFDGFDVELVDAETVETIVCSGLFDDRTETPDDYDDLLEKLARCNIPMICANPDLVVELGDRLLYCAGSLAALYAQKGGTSLIAGKPHHPIYEAALREAEALTGRKFEKNQILAIGDGMPTDIKGAVDFGIDVLFISSGIHAGEYGNADDPDRQKLAAFIAARGLTPTATMPRLKW